ncbi:hypothetical protein D3C73_1633590 [compost metagenome]
MIVPQAGKHLFADVEALALNLRPFIQTGYGNEDSGGIAVRVPYRSDIHPIVDRRQQDKGEYQQHRYRNLE